MKSKPLGMSRPKLKPMIWGQVYGVWLNVAKHETQTWHAYIQPETIKLTSNQTADPKVNIPRMRGLLQSSPSTWNDETHPETTPFKHNQNVGAQAMRPRVRGLLQVGFSPPQMTTCNHPRPIPNLQIKPYTQSEMIPQPWGLGSEAFSKWDLVHLKWQHVTIRDPFPTYKPYKRMCKQI
jgi:hypothetical protein